MNKASILFLTAALAISSVGGAALAQDKPAAAPAAPAAPAADAKPASPFKTLQEKASYIIGLNLGQSLHKQEIPCTGDVIVKGLLDGLSGATPALSPEEIQTVMQEFQQQISAQQEAKQKVVGEKNLKESQIFLDQNKTKAGVKTTASGLQYEVMAEGSGESPKATDQVTVNYKGTLLDGKVFDSSYDRGEPVTFPVNGVIPGWVEALQLMKPGAKYKLYLPPALGYGERGAGADIGPNQALVFEVELISIAKGGAEPDQEVEEAPPAEETQPEKPPTQ